LIETDLILIATPDDRVGEAAGLIVENAETLRGAVALHTSGALSSDALGSLRAYAIATASCHPLQTFGSPARAVGLLKDSYFCIEGEPRAERIARRLVRSIGARSFTVTTEMKSLYHAAAVLASGGVVSLLGISIDMLMKCGLSDTQSRKILVPLVEGTVENVRTSGPARALTGPVRRGDAGTVSRNLKAIAKHDRRWVDLYALLALQSLVLAERAGADPHLLEAVRRLLESASKKRGRAC
jgi:predicted short-subunit dehydrogenase-like oxidoreductase (DUF2520 family)